MSHTNDESLDATSSVGQWVAHHPATANVFDMLHIDYCCDGGKPLENACWEHGLEVIRVHALLKHTVAQSVASFSSSDWLHAPLADLCDHIEKHHHSVLKQSLPLLSDMMADVVELHGSEHEELRDVQHHFITWRDEILALMIEQERSLFPAIRRFANEPDSRSSLAESLIKMMSRASYEHTDIGEAMKQANRAADGFTKPTDACPKFAQMYGLLRWIEADIRQHVHKEESILFPRIKDAIR